MEEGREDLHLGLVANAEAQRLPRASLTCPSAQPRWPNDNNNVQ